MYNQLLLSPVTASWVLDRYTTSSGLDVGLPALATTLSDYYCALLLLLLLLHLRVLLSAVESASIYPEGQAVSR